MSAQTGAAFLLKITDGSVPPNFQTVAGLRTTQMAVAGQAVVVTSKDSNGWRELLSGGGARSVSISAAGIFMGSAAETRIAGNAMTGVLDTYLLTMQGKFLVQKLNYSGDFNNERSYTLQLESSGAVVAA